jgi:FkbM family methyltransferase
VTGVAAPCGKQMIVDSYVREVPRFKPHTIVHVGANTAQELDRYEALEPRRVVWIEADPSIVPETRKHVAAHGSAAVEHICAEALVTDADAQEASFNLFSNRGESSSLFRSTEVGRRAWPGIAETGEVKRLKTSRLDTLLRGLSIEADQVDMLVIDVQGAELLCLKGAGEYLECATFVEVEVSREAVYEGGVLFPELDDYLSRSGYARVSPLPWHGDVVYVRRSDLALRDFDRLRRRAAAPDPKRRHIHTPRFLRHLLGRS